MKPSQVVQALRRIASGIDKSRKPQKHLVAADVKKIISSLHLAEEFNFDHTTDGPVDPFVVISRACEAASSGKNCEAVANSLYETLKEHGWLKEGEIPSSEFEGGEDDWIDNTIHAMPFNTKSREES